MIVQLMRRKRIVVDRDRDVVNLEVSVDDQGCLVLQYASNIYRHARLAAHYRGAGNVPKTGLDKRQRRVRLLEDDGGLRISGIDVKNIRLEDGSYNVEIGTEYDAEFLIAVLKLPGTDYDDMTSTVTFPNSLRYNTWFRYVSGGRAPAQLSVG